MGKCFSNHGEFSDHKFGPKDEERFICQVCYTFDEEKALKRIEELEDRLYNCTCT